MTYTLITNQAGVRRDGDGALIPSDPRNMDWQAYQAWLAEGNAPAPAPGPTVEALTAYAEQAWAALLAKGQTFDVASATATPIKIHCDGTRATRADLALLALFGQASPTGQKTWIDNNGVATALTGAELVLLATLAGEWIADTYPALAALIADITATPPRITTVAEIDAYVWPTT
jgi:hypothetical protein